METEVGLQTYWCSPHLGTKRAESEEREIPAEEKFPDFVLDFGFVLA
jgi:hypothetical protein